MSAPIANFNYKRGSGYELIFSDLSTNGPTTRSWVFGDGTTSSDASPTHDYTRNGFFEVTLTVTNADGSDSITLPVGIRQDAVCLSQSVYTLVLQYIPANITYSPSELSGLIQKHQLFLQPLVNHTIEDVDIYDEFAWEPLENILIASLAAYDMIIQSANAYISSVANGGTTTNRAVKKITTGPVDVEWFPDTEAGDSFKSIFSAGGAVSEIKTNICSLASRLNIYLAEICPRKKITVIPKVYPVTASEDVLTLLQTWK